MNLFLLSCENPFMLKILEPKTIYFNSNGGSKVANQNLWKGNKVKKPADPAKASHTFAGWFEDNNKFTKAWIFDTVPTADVTLHAKWNADKTDPPDTGCEHQWGVWTVTTPAYCTAAGEETRICTIDPIHKEIRPMAPLGHDMKWVETKVPTYTEEGIETYTCQRIGCTHTAGTRTIPQLVITPDSDLSSILASLPGNTAATPYVLVVNIGDLSSIGDTLNANPDKYVILDMSGSTFNSIGDYAFAACQSLITVTIPDGVESIGAYAFRDCTGLKNIVTGDSVKSISIGTFFGCASLESITIPSAVTCIEVYAFYGCVSLKSVTFEGTIQEADFSDGSRFPGDLRDVYLYHYSGEGGIGTYTTTRSPNDDYTAKWTKQ
jgi:uncharacterized repeat protein (TIGR02543 family)